MNSVSLEVYKVEERRLAAQDARRGFRVHAVVTVIVVAALLIVNILVSPEFPWVAFVAAGMGIGLGCHWYFGIHRGEEFLLRHQEDVEREAERIAV